MVATLQGGLSAAEALYMSKGCDLEGVSHVAVKDCQIYLALRKIVNAAHIQGNDCLSLRESPPALSLR